MTNVIQLIKDIVSALVVHDKDGVKFVIREEDGNVVVAVYPSDADMSRIVGKNGSTANAINTILKKIDSPDGKRYFFQVGDHVRCQGGRINMSCSCDGCKRRGAK
ncbi:MAG: KH domain-containing protein [Firmicutes bacterium]|nr:KH domain-containing protein [Bacillota bacterium]